MDSISHDDKIQIVRLYQSVTIQHCLLAPTLKSLEAQFGQDDLATVIAYQIMQTSDFFNLKANLREDQALETAYLILEKYPFETLEDFAIVFKNAKTGKYGELFNRLDGQIIFKWMEHHLEDKAIQREKLHQAAKFVAGEENLMQIVQNHTQEQKQLTEPKNNEIRKSVIDALKQAIDYEQLVKQELDYQEFKKQFIQKKNNGKNVIKTIEKKQKM